MIPFIEWANGRFLDNLSSFRFKSFILILMAKQLHLILAYYLHASITGFIINRRTMFACGTIVSNKTLSVFLIRFVNHFRLSPLWFFGTLLAGVFLFAFRTYIKVEKIIVGHVYSSIISTICPVVIMCSSAILSICVS